MRAGPRSESAVELAKSISCRAHAADAYPHPTDKVEHLETHISDVLLTGGARVQAEEAARPRLSRFLHLSKNDATTAKKSCGSIVASRRILYLAVLPIAGRARTIRGWVRRDRSLDYALQMRQFDQSGLLERALTSGRAHCASFGSSWLRSSRSFMRISRRIGDSQYGTAAAIMAPARQNFDQLRRFSTTPARRERLDQRAALDNGVNTAIWNVFRAAPTDGFVRECHGDLHLANMVLIDDQRAHIRLHRVQSRSALDRCDERSRVREHGSAATTPWPFRLALSRSLSADDGGLWRRAAAALLHGLSRIGPRQSRGHESRSRRCIDPATRDALVTRCRAHIELAGELSSAPSPVTADHARAVGLGKNQLSQVLLETLGAIRIRSGCRAQAHARLSCRGAHELSTRGRHVRRRGQHQRLMSVCESLPARS